MCHLTSRPWATVAEPRDRMRKIGRHFRKPENSSQVKFLELQNHFPLLCVDPRAVVSLYWVVCNWHPPCKCERKSLKGLSLHLLTQKKEQLYQGGTMVSMFHDLRQSDTTKGNRAGNQDWSCHQPLLLSLALRFPSGSIRCRSRTRNLPPRINDGLFFQLNSEISVLRCCDRKAWEASKWQVHIHTEAYLQYLKLHTQGYK